MSLKAFHFVFIAASILLSLGFAAWSAQQFTVDRSALSAVFALAGIAASLALARYGVGIMRKLKHVSYL